LQKESSEKIYINSGNEDVLKLVTRPNCKILDAGCGSGSLAQILSDMGHQVNGITISAKEYEAAGKFLQTVYLHNLETGLPENVLHSQYDYVICSHVLEHIVYPDKLLKDIYRVLKPGGFLVVALPNIMHYKSRLQLLAGKFSYQEAGIWDYTHVKWYTFDSAQKLLVDHGFQIELANVTGELPFNSLFSKIFSSNLRKAVFSFLISISKGFFGYQLLFKVKK
jgi:ubiquinone/menaquinone biosynthesis C-methylase UbiE